MKDVKTQLTEKNLKDLKKKSGENTVKDALSKAIDHYLTCSHTNDDSL